MVTLCEQDAEITGPIGMFLGIETAQWSQQQFIGAANFAKQHGITTLFIKVAEVGSTAGGATGYWYDGIDGFDAIYQKVHPMVNVIPYIFPYGDSYGSLQKEVDIARAFMQKYQKLCLDMEGGWWVNANAASWAKSFANVLAPMPGKLWISCPADPVRNGQLPFLKAISPAANIYMPMVYSNDLDGAWVSDYQQVNPQACLQPTIDLSQEFGPNNVLAIVNHIKSQGCHALSIWYVDFAYNDPALVDHVVQKMKGQPPMGTPPERSTWLSAGQEQQAKDTWQIGVEFVKAVFNVDIPPGTAIFKSWEHEYQNGRNRGFPTTPEKHTVNWGDKPMVVMYFSTGDRCEWDGNGSPHWYHG